MKNLALLFAVVFVFSATNLNAQKFKYGHIDGNAVYKKMPEVQKADTIYTAYVKQLEDQIKSMQEEYNKKATDYQKNEATLSDLMKETKVEELKSLGERIQKFQVSAQEDAIKKQKEMYDPIRKKFDSALEVVAKKYGYKFIIDRNALLYFNDVDDVTAFVKKELGIK
ncbi:MAG: OmpH family outer membrane protein [Bacteroidales bacterium]|nr:OmpH family outer membrane protein [Bacteroidales bacterium]